jgi:hypothetical protein
MNIDTFIEYMTTPNWPDALRIYVTIALLALTIKIQLDNKGIKK